LLLMLLFRAAESSSEKSILQVTIEAGWDSLWVLPLAVTTPVPQAARRLPPVHPDMTKTLTIVALSDLQTSTFMTILQSGVKLIPDSFLA
jgi:hypothetical protein